MPNYSEILKDKLYGDGWNHPYRIYEKTIRDYLKPESVILDAGCGREASVLRKLNVSTRLAVGVDLCELSAIEINTNIKLTRSDLVDLGLKNESVDIVASRSVLEHIKYPKSVYGEIYRVLKPGGHFILLTPNLFDYGSLLSLLVPNRLHPCVVRITEGRREIDTFPVFYKSNTERSIRALGEKVGLRVCEVKYLGQYPSYLMFNCLLFVFGALYDKLISSTEMLRKLRGWILTVMVKEVRQEGQCIDRPVNS
jgi:SAM-dependent methyltransferase